MKMIQPRTQQRRVSAGTSAAELRHAIPAVPHVVARRAGNLGELASRSAVRATTNGAALAAAVTLHPGSQTWNEWMALQDAVFRRFGQLQQQWWHGWGEWLHQSVQIRKADTMSEFVEQQYNIVAQAGALWKDQASDLLSLQENIEVDYGYWAAQKIHDAVDAGGQEGHRESR